MRGAAATDVEGRFELGLRHGRLDAFVVRGAKGEVMRTSASRVEVTAEMRLPIQILVLASAR